MKRRTRSVKNEKLNKEQKEVEEEQAILLEEKVPATKSGGKVKRLRIWLRALNSRRTFFLFGLVFGSLLISLLSPNISINKLNLEHYLFLNFPSLRNSDLFSNLTSFITENLSSTSNDELPAHSLKSQLHANYPVFLVPGIVSTNLESWARGGCAEQYFRKKVWGDLTMLSSLLLDKECWLKNLMLDTKTGMDPDQIKLRAVQGIDAANYFMPGYWVWAKLMENLAIIGYDTNNMHMASYDWRLSFENLERRDGYFTKLRANIETSRRLSGKKAVLISHSMGGIVVNYFLKWVENSMHGAYIGWVQTHIHAVVNIGAPYLGVPKTLPSVLSGETRDTAQLGWLTSNVLERFFTRKERAALFQSWGGLASMHPKGGESIWGNNQASPDSPYENRSFGNLISFTRQTDVALTSKNYTANSIFSLLKNYCPSTYSQNVLSQYSHGISFRDLTHHSFNNPKYWVNPLQYTLPDAPSLTLYSLYGVGKPTERSYMYDYSESVIPMAYEVLEDKSEDLNTTLVKKTDRVVGLHVDTESNDEKFGLNSGVQDSDGDGTVPLVSLGFMPVAGWRHGPGNTYGHIYNPGKVKIVAREYEHNPASLVKDPRGGPETADHVDILGNKQLTIDILKIVSGKDHDLSDRILSNIKKIADKIELIEEHNI